MPKKRSKQPWPRRAPPRPEPLSPAAATRILGVDCGSSSTGVGIVERNGRAYRVLYYGAIRTTPARPFGERLQTIHDALLELIGRFEPTSVAVEQVFQAFNVKSAMQLSQVRGIVHLVAAESGLPIHEYSALAVKNRVVGYGLAKKHQVQRMVQRLLGLARPPRSDDAADALALALCHCYAEAPRPRQN